LKELPTGPALLSAGSQHRPDASVPLPAHQGSAALGNSPINNSLMKSLLSSIVGRWNSKVKQKSEHISVKRDRLVNLILPERLSIDPFMAQLAALIRRKTSSSFVDTRLLRIE
jgi:hypothetical protein